MKSMQISTNLAISADGKISPSRKVAGAFTGKEDGRRFHELRSACDALIVGRGTLEADNMTMLVRDRDQSEQPLRCIVSTSGQFDFNHKIFSTPGGRIHLVVTGEQKVDGVPEGVFVHYMALREFLDYLENTGIQRLHCEGGGGLIHELASLGRIGTFNLTIAPHHLFGGWEAPTPTGNHRSNYLPHSVHFQLSDWQQVENGEVLATYQVSEK